jgi:hypothetical protein
VRVLAGEQSAPLTTVALVEEVVRVARSRCRRWAGSPARPSKPAVTARQALGRNVDVEHLGKLFHLGHEIGRITQWKSATLCGPLYQNVSTW